MAPVSGAIQLRNVVTAHVEERAGAYVVVDAAGAVLSTHAGRDEALSACARACGAVSKEPVLRVDGSPSASWRWLDASVPESASDFPDGHLDLTTLEEVAASLNASPMPSPVTGGRVSVGSPSEVHGTSRDSATAANGWAHSAVFLVRGGVPHMYLFAELLQEVAVDVDRGRLAFGSVEVGAKGRDESGALRGAELIAHALTNKPANRNIAPGSATRSEALVMRASPTLLQGNAHMAKKPAAEETPAPEAVRAETPPVAEEPSGEVSVDKDAMIAELEAKVAELTAQVDAMRSEMEARAAAMPSEEEAAKAAEAKREAEIKEALDSAQSEGRILPATRASWERVARASGVAEFQKLTKGLRALPTRQVAGRGEASPTPATKRGLDKDDPYVVAMRAAGLKDDKIEAALAARMKEI